MQTEDLVNGAANLDDSVRFAEMILEKGRFHRILVESLGRGVNKDQNEEKKPKEKSKKKKNHKLKKEKNKKEKYKAENETEEQMIEEMLEKIRLKKEKLELRKEREKEKEKGNKKKKKKKSKKKKKKRESKTKTETIEISDHDSDDEGFNCWWSIGIEHDNRDEGDKIIKAEKTQIVSKTPSKKGSKRSRKKCIDKTDHSFTDQSATDHSTAEQSTADQSTSVTEHTARSSLASSHQWSFSSPIVRKVSDDLSEHAVTTATILWWENVKETIPYTPTTLPAKTPTTTPTIAPKRGVIPMLLSPRSDTSDSDYDDVSIFSEESLSEEILDDLSCILDCSDGSENDVEEKPASNKSYDSSSICSGPFHPISSLRKAAFIRESTADPCMTPTPGRHLSNVKIISTRPSPYSVKGSSSPCAKSPRSNGSSPVSSPVNSRSRSHTGSRTDPTRNRPVAVVEKTEQGSTNSTRNKNYKNEVRESPHLDGIQPIPRDGLFSPNKAIVSPSLDGIQAVPTNGLFGNRKRNASPSLPDKMPLS